jgi:hypothetical protein
MASHYYQPSGRLPARALGGIVLSALATLPLAWLYAIFTFYNPFFVFNVIATICLAVLLGAIGMLVARYGKVRNPAAMAWLGCAIGVACWYFQWAAWNSFFAREAFGDIQTTSSMFELAAEPGRLLHIAFELKDIRRVFGQAVPGWFMLLAWLVELLMLAALPCILSIERARTPFCEDSDRWGERIDLPRQLRFIDDAHLLIATLEHDPGRLPALLSAGGQPERRASIKLYRCGQRDSYVSIFNEVRQPGKMRRSMHRLVDHLHIPERIADELVRQYGDAPVQGSGDEAAPDPPELELAIAYLNDGAFTQAIAEARRHTHAERQACRRDANRICALASSRLGQWEGACGYWHALWCDEATAGTALALARSSVLAGNVARGETWLARAIKLNAETGELAQSTIDTAFIDALAEGGHAQEAMRYRSGLKPQRQSEPGLAAPGSDIAQVSTPS